MSSVPLSTQVLELLDRPNEPIFSPKGDRGIVYNVPDDYLEERFKGNEVSNRFGNTDAERVPIKKINLPDFSEPMKMKKEENFSVFIPNHQRYAARVIQILVEMRTQQDFISASAFCRENLNAQLFNYAFSVAILHREDTKKYPLPPLSSAFPDKFMDSRVIKEARETANLQTQVETIRSVPIEIPMDYTATDLEDEHRMAYFREDLGINLHHWHWHLVYPFNGPRRIIAKDRRGELFYYMHHQIIARYNFDRFCNKLARVQKYSDWDQPIKEGYFPKLNSMISSRVWAGRPPNEILKDINRPSEGLTLDVNTLKRWRNALSTAMQTGRVTDENGQSIQLTEETGIDILGNMVEASDLSINKNLYGDMHNFGHILMGLVHDPDNRYLETFSVMGDGATTMRDPLFYRWHGFVDEMFNEYKQTLPSYTAQQLTFDNVRVTDIEITSRDNPKNEFNTFWERSTVDLGRGLDFAPRGSVLARFTHLQHVPFQYRITVNNSGPARQGTVRIFLAPQNDERSIPVRFSEQRLLMVELDRFTVNLKPNQDVIIRSSGDSSVTIPFEVTFRNLNAATPQNLDQFNFCGCGWPEHMLIPKGTPEGYPAVLFVMITDFEADKVDDPNAAAGQCADAVSYCGLQNAKYPDRRPMGFPFDRIPRQGADSLPQFLTPNMQIKNVTIKFSNRVIDSTRPLPTTQQQQRPK